MILQALMKNIVQSPKTRSTPKKHSIQQSNTITNYFNVKQPLASANQANHQHQFNKLGRAKKRERGNTFHCSLPKKIKQEHVDIHEVIVISDSEDNCDEDRNNNINERMEKNVCVEKEIRQVSMPPKPLHQNLDKNFSSKQTGSRKDVLVLKAANKNLNTFKSQSIKTNQSPLKKGHNLERNIWTDLPDIMDNMHTISPSKNVMTPPLGRNLHGKIAICSLKKTSDGNDKDTKPIDVDEFCSGMRQLSGLSAQAGSNTVKSVTQSTLSSNNVKANFSCVSLPRQGDIEPCRSVYISSDSSDDDNIFADGVLNPLIPDIIDVDNVDDDEDSDLPEFFGNSIKTTAELSKTCCSGKENAQQVCHSETTKSVLDCNDNVSDALSSYIENPALNLDRNFLSSQESNCSISPVLEKLQRAALACPPMTPRHGKKLRRSAEDDDSLDNSPHIENEVSEPKRRKLHFSLNRMIRDQRKNEELNLIEKKLLANVKKGGFHNYLDHSSDDEDGDSDNQTQKEHLAVLSRIASSKDDCLSLPDSHFPVKIVDPNFFCSFYCIHTLHHCEKSESLTRLDVCSMLQLLRTGRFSEMADRKFCGKTEMLSFLLKVLCTTTDSVLLKCAFQAYAQLGNDQKVLDCHLQQLDEAVLNVGVKRTLFNPVHRQVRTKRKICKQCKMLKLPTRVLLKNLLHIIKVLKTISTWSVNGLTNNFIAPYLKLCCLLLTNTQFYSIHFDFQSTMSTLVLAVTDWPSMRLRTTREVVEAVEDLPTLDHIVSSIPACNERCLELRRSIAQAAIHKFLNPTSSSLPQPTPLVTFDLARIVEFAKQLEIPRARAYVTSRNPAASTRDAFYSLYACVSMLQACIGSCEPNNKPFTKKHLESISTNLRSLSVSIRDNGCLFASEVKHFIRIVIANIDLQVQAMPSTRNYQQSIFKFLGSSRVDELVIGEAWDEADDDKKYVGHSSYEEPMDTTAALPASYSQPGPSALANCESTMDWESFSTPGGSLSVAQYPQPNSVTPSGLPSCSVQSEVRGLLRFLVDSTCVNTSR